MLHHRWLLHLLSQLTLHHTPVSMIKKVLYVVLLFCKLFANYSCYGRYSWVIVRLQRFQFPKTAVNSAGALRVIFSHIKVVLAEVLLRLGVRWERLSVNHEGTSWMLSQEIVDKRYNSHDGSGRGSETESRQAFDE